MSKLKKGAQLSCVPCGREVVVDACGISSETIWCCGKPMSVRPKAHKKKTAGKAKKKKK